MDTPRSARPPKPAPDLSSDAAQAFLAAVSPPDPVQALKPEAPGRGKVPLRVISLRIPQDMHDKLARIASATPHSANAFIVAALGPAIEAELARIRRREDLGL